jgi:hypothetical protein
MSNSCAARAQSLQCPSVCIRPCHGSFTSLPRIAPSKLSTATFANIAAAHVPSSLSPATARSKSPDFSPIAIAHAPSSQTPIATSSESTKSSSAAAVLTSRSSSSHSSVKANALVYATQIISVSPVNA